jgi:DMSO/TMAO reductase YedYZ molybdopterin-dependent catalytic subunit
MLGFGLLAPLTLHVWRRWPRPRKVDFTSRRAALKLLVLGVAGLAGWWTAEALAGRRELPEAARRFTGSRLDGLYSGNRFPVTHTRAASLEQVDPSTWKLRVEGAVASPQTLALDELLALPPASLDATLDCTLGWYTIQTWSGFRLADLLKKAGASPEAIGVRLESVTGYAHLFPLAETDQILLANQVGGETLDHWHGFPLRAVAPSRRGWFWIKWLARIEVISL